MLLDVFAALLVLGAGTAFFFGAFALGRSNDVEALYSLVVGFVALRAAVHIFRPGTSS